MVVYVFGIEGVLRVSEPAARNSAPNPVIGRPELADGKKTTKGVPSPTGVAAARRAGSREPRLE